MTITNTTPMRKQYDGDGATDTFPYDWKIFKASDLVVTLTDSTGLPKTSILGTGHAVTGVGLDTYGNVVTTDPVPEGSTITISSGMPNTQETRFRGQHSFFPESHEAALDKLTQLIRQLSERHDRSIHVPVTTDLAFSTELPAPTAGCALGWNSDLLGLGNLLGPSAGTIEDARDMTLTKIASDTYVDTSRFGITGTGTETTAFEQAIAAAVAAGHKRVFLNTPSLTVATGTDCQGCQLIGAPTTLVNRVKNVSRHSGIITAGEYQDRHTIHPGNTQPSNKFKILEFVEEGEMNVFTPLEPKGYARLVLRNNVTTTNESLADTATDTTPWRFTYAYRVVDVLMAFQTYSDSGGSWTTTAVGVDVDDVYTMGTEYLKVYRCAASAAYLEYTITLPKDGHLNIALLSGAAATDDFSITVNGDAVVSNATLITASPSVIVIDYHHPVPTERTAVVRITNNSGGSGALQIIGLNYCHLRDYDGTMDVDAFGYYLNSTLYKDYVTSQSANDYALRDADADLWGGSYHGGEGSISTTLKLDGVVTSIPSSAGVVGIARSIVFEQTSTLDWSGSGGGEIDIRTTLSFVDGGLLLSSAFEGSMVAKFFYTTLIGVSENFTQIYFPRFIPSIADFGSNNIHFGNTNSVEMRTAAGTQAIKINHTIFTNGEDFWHGGTYVQRQVGSYHKYYYSHISDGARPVTHLSAVTQIVFS